MVAAGAQVSEYDGQEFRGASNKLMVFLPALGEANGLAYDLDDIGEWIDRRRRVEYEALWFMEELSELNGQDADTHVQSISHEGCVSVGCLAEERGEQ